MGGGGGGAAAATVFDIVGGGGSGTLPTVTVVGCSTIGGSGGGGGGCGTATSGCNFSGCGVDDGCSGVATTSTIIGEDMGGCAGGTWDAFCDNAADGFNNPVALVVTIVISDAAICGIRVLEL
jgi:hypothetical protein